MSVAAASIASRPVARRAPATAPLVAVLVVATGWAILAGGWTDSTPSVVLVGLAGAAESYALARLGASRGVALLAAPFLLFASLVPTTIGTRPHGTSSAIGHVLVQYLDAAVTGLLGNAQWEFNVALGALLWVCGAWAAWFAVRERRGTVATAPCWAVLAVNVINAPSTSGVTLPAAVAAAAAILLIAAVHLDRLSDSWARRRVSVLPGTGGRFATAALVGGALVVLLAMVAPPLTSTDVSGQLFGFGSGGSGGGHGPGGRLGGGATVRFNAATVPGGALSLSGSLVMTYQSSLATGVYLRMATDGVFDSGNWLPDDSANDNGDDAQEISDPGVIARDRRVDVGGGAIDQQAVSLTVKLVDDTSDTNTLPFAGEPQSASVAARVNGLTGPETDGQLLSVDSVEALRSVAGTTFSTVATESTATADQLRNAGTAYPSFITRDFLGINDDNTGGLEVIRSLAQSWTRTATNPYDAAVLIENTLRDPRQFRYTLKPTLPPNTIWPVTYFLTVSHAGYCQYFAASMGAMLRALGIPARLVNGYGPGTTPNAAARRTSPDANWTVTSDDAHTWVEAYFPRYGWIPFEPTPPSIAGDYQPFVRGAIGVTSGSQPSSGGNTTVGATPTARPVKPDVATGPTTTPVRSSGGRAVLLVLGSILGLIVLAGALFAAWFLAPRDIRGVWRRVGVVGRLVGVRRERSTTFGEFAKAVCAAVPAEPGADGPGAPSPRGGDWRTRTRDALTEIAVLSDRVFYGPGGATAMQTASMKSAWRRLALLAPHLGRRVPAATDTGV